MRSVATRKTCAELARRRASAQLEQRRVEALDVADGRVDAGRLARVDDRAGLGGRGGQRLLDEDVDALGRASVRTADDVLLGRHGDDREVGRPGGEQAVEVGEHAGPASRDGAEAVAAGIDGAGEGDARRGLQQPRVMAADHAQPEHGAAQRPGGVWARHGATRVSAMPDHPAPGLVLSPTASVGRDVSFGANVVVHDGVVIGDGVVVQDNVVLGKPPRLAPTSRRAAHRRSTPLVIEEGAAVCAGAIVFAGAHIGAGAIVGDQSYVRERSARRRRTASSGAARPSTTTSSSARASRSRPTST